MKIYFDDKVCCIPDMNAFTNAISRTNRSVKFLTLVTSALFVYILAHNSKEHLISKCVHNRLINIDDKIRKFTDNEDNEK